MPSSMWLKFHDPAAKPETACTPPSPANHEDDDDNDDDADESDDDDDDNHDDDSDEDDDEDDADEDDDEVDQADDDDNGDDGDDGDDDNREDEEDDDEGACYDDQVDDDDDDDDDAIGVQPCKASNSRELMSQVSPLYHPTQMDVSSRLPFDDTIPKPYRAEDKILPKERQVRDQIKTHRLSTGPSEAWQWQRTRLSR